MADTAVFALPERADQSFLSALITFLDEHPAQDVALDAGKLRQFDMFLGQVLLVAKRQLRDQGLQLQLQNLSPAHHNQIALSGLSGKFDELMA